MLAAPRNFLAKLPPAYALRLPMKIRTAPISRSAILRLMFAGAFIIGNFSGLSAAQPVQLSLDGDWQFTYTASTGAELPQPPSAAMYVSTIKIPGWWDEQLDRLRDAPWFKQAEFRETQGPVKYLSGIGWHRKTFQAPEAWRGRVVTLTVGRAVTKVNVWLNGRHVAGYDYGAYTPFQVDLSEKLDYGKTNELVISVENKKIAIGGSPYVGNAGQASGIAESVTLAVAAGPGRLADLYIQPGNDLKEVEWNLELEVPAGKGSSASSSVAWEVWDTGKKKLMGQGSVPVPAFEKTHHLSWRAQVTGIQPWSDRHPNLYRTRLRWVATDGQTWDELEQRFGLRRFTLNERKLLLNDKPIYLRGLLCGLYFPIHCSLPSDKAYWTDLCRRLKNIGFNYLNFVTQVCPRAVLEAADEEGMIVQCGDHETVLEPFRKYFDGVWPSILRWTREYPSMCIYGFGGERDYYEGIIEQYQLQYDLIKKMNPAALVMPQQAIRGIDYSFDEQGKKELTRKPFPHHAERLARYTKACDLFGHYSGGALSYSFDKPPTWQGMDERFRIYSKPLSAHELFMGASYLNPDNTARYTGRVPPYLYTDLRDRLKALDLLDKWPIYFRNSVRLQSICAKYNLEKVRKCHELVAFEILSAYDLQFIPYYTVGLLDEFLSFKPGNDAQTYLRYNSENVLLIDYDKGSSINRAYYAGNRFSCDALLSLYGEDDLKDGTFSWTLSREGKSVLSGTLPVKPTATGGVTTLGQVELTWPEVSETTRFNLSFSLQSKLAPIRNDWDFWVFPKREPQALTAAADDKILQQIGKRYAGLVPFAGHEQLRLQIVETLTSTNLDHLANGGDVLLLGTKPFTINDDFKSFRSGLGDGERHNIGTILARHPIFADLPNDGWADWHFYSLLDGAYAFVIDDEAMGGFDPILEVISNPLSVRKQAMIFERRIGKGRLLASSCVNDLANPACVALLDGIMRYVTSEKFQPALAMKLDQQTLAEFAAAPPPKDQNNLVLEPFFDRRAEVLATWQPIGNGFEVDRGVAHSGRGSLRLRITPEQIKDKPGFAVGARAVLPKTKTDKPLRLAAWCKTEGVTGASAGELSMNVALFIEDGTRDTVRLSLPPGTHNWQLVQAVIQPRMEMTVDKPPLMSISMTNHTGTVWLDDLYFGP
jgi:hypothetical protein